ncbi:LppU/SCO3897 family protein [Nocardia vulneris]|uniref:Secreted protein n=1 Tax=Nocardia vulneris TaxID=1141657 RepID=A0ABR4ZMS1_9NOCA|nr:hypothetical protein [Nocardia vulneris]KIA66229.1 hypothetical protein FG87_03500 [Nocardia vulneris]
MRNFAAPATVALGALSITCLVGSGIAAAVPDSVESLEVGDCINYSDRSGTPVDCGSLEANYRLVEKTYGECSDPAADVEFSTGDRNGNVSPTYCFVFDWREGTCYDFTGNGPYHKVDCAVPGNEIGRVTAIHQGVADSGLCGEREDAVTNQRFQLTICYVPPRR